MLVLSRKVDEKVVIDGGIVVTVVLARFVLPDVVADRRHQGRVATDPQYQGAVARHVERRYALSRYRANYLELLTRLTAA